jgi:endonuclease YncB( thermonuclease family)
VIPRLFVLVLLLVGCSAGAETIADKVVKVADGDTITILAERKQTRVRLANIDTPERRQPWGKKAKQALADLVAGEWVEVEVLDVDRYGRTIGLVRVGGIEANRALVRSGDAWVYPKYNRDPGLPDIEAEARAAGRGLWSLPAAERIPPWEWRREHRRRRKH